LSFSYGLGLNPPVANPPIDYPRLLVSDTKEFASNGTTRIYIFEDAEIQAAALINGAVWQSAQFYSGPAGTYLPPTPVNYLRTAALLLDSLAANRSRLASIKQVLDIKLDPAVAAKNLKDQAQAYRDADDNSGAFIIAEQVNDQFSFADRWWKQIQRQAA
jgi:hypothetical protein